MTNWHFLPRAGLDPRYLMVARRHLLLTTAGSPYQSPTFFSTIVQISLINIPLVTDTTHKTFMRINAAQPEREIPVYHFVPFLFFQHHTRRTQHTFQHTSSHFWFQRRSGVGFASHEPTNKSTKKEEKSTHRTRGAIATLPSRLVSHTHTS